MRVEIRPRWGAVADNIAQAWVLHALVLVLWLVSMEHAQALAAEAVILALCALAGTVRRLPE